MRAYFLAGAALISGITAAAGARPTRAVRTVQLISMSASPAPSSESVPIGPSEQLPAETGDAASTDTSPLPEAFRVHDLSRRWVAYQMANSFAPQSAAAPASNVGSGAGEDPFAAVGVAQPGVPAFGASVGVSPASTISVPLWMRGDQVFASAANSYVPGCVPTDYRPSGILRPDGEFPRGNLR